jgi:hypothetical protein
MKKLRITFWHATQCAICWDMERRGYISEQKYWDDYFNHKEKPIKYKLVLPFKTMDEMESELKERLR